MSPDPVSPPPTGWPAFAARLRWQAVVLTLLLAFGGALLLSPVFVTPFVVVWARTTVLGAALLLVWAAARAWPRARGLRWMSPHVSPVVAVIVAAPLVTALIYVVTSGGVRGFLGAPGRLMGFAVIAGTAALLGLVAAVSAGVRERIAQAEAQALRMELERSRFERQAAEARLALLQAQIEPHFLFNTIANVQALVEAGSPRAAPVLARLAEYLRASMPRLHDATPTLADEAARVRAYLELMAMRMPDRLAWSVAIPDELAARPFPPLALLTLVENAVRHGIDPAEDGGRIDVGAGVEAGTLRLWVADTGVGLDPRAGAGTGLANLRERLRAAWGDAAALELAENAPHGLRATIRIPA